MPSTSLGAGGIAADPPLSRAYAPLAAAALLTALAGPVLNLELARDPSPASALAGFWLGYSVLLLLEAACVVWQSTSLAFLGTPRARRRLGWLALATGTATSVLVWLAGQPASSAWLFREVVPTSRDAALTAANVLRALAPLPAIVALRGVLAASVLRDGRGAAIPAALLARLAVLSAWPLLPHGGTGVRSACEALLAGGVIELVVLALARSAALPHAAHHVPPAAARVAAVAAPLVAATLAWAALRPGLHAVLGRLDHPELAQARFGLVFAVFMALCAPVWALRDLALLAEGAGASRDSVRRFAGRVAAAASIAFAAVLVGAALRPDMGSALGFGPATGEFAWAAVALLTLAPALVAARMPAQGQLIARHVTSVFGWAPALRLALTVGLGLIAARFAPRMDGATLGAALLLAGEVFEVWAYERAVALTPGSDRPQDVSTPHADGSPDSIARAA
ncbi:MAG: hypothetical protein IT347_01545 [Candidatus Eisenbacteria bacterium]|nr:hypothetical protein [Candidatus Eisenbacteria bacterium]